MPPPPELGDGGGNVGVIEVVYTLLAVCVGFVVFRAASLAEAMTVLRAMFTGFALSPASTLALERISPAVWCALGAGIVGSLPVGRPRPY